MAEVFVTTKETNKEPNSKLTIVVLVAVAAFFSVFLLFFLIKNLSQNGDVQEPKIKNTLPDNYQYVPTETGKYPVGFPKELILEKKVSPYRGEDTTTGAGENQKIIEYFSSSTPSEVYSLYKGGIVKAGWKLDVDSNNNDVKVLIFKKDTKSFEVITTAHEAGSQIKLNYISANDPI